MMYHIKDNHNLVGLYSLSSWDPGNIVIDNLDSEKNWKEELVVVDSQWYSDDTLPKEIPLTTFGIAKHWKKTYL